ncbi:hypothetical protein [Hydrogenivirga sp.]
MAIFTAILVILFLNFSFAVEAVINFGRLTPDGEIVDLTEKCNAEIKSFWYATPYGVSGSGSETKWLKPRKFFKIARKRLSEGFKVAYFNKAINLKIMVENRLFTAEDLEKHNELNKFVKGLVNSYFQQNMSYIYVKSEGPIIYAILIKTDNLSCIESSNIVKDISVNEFPLFRKFLKYVPYYFRPEEYSRYYWFPEVKTATPTKLFYMIKGVVKKIEEDEEFVEYYKKLFAEEDLYKKRLEFLNGIIRKKFEKVNAAPTYFPSDGTIFYTGTNVVDYDIIQWDLPGDWSVDRPGYEHDLVAKRDYFTSCYSSTSLPEGYDDCETACISEITGEYCAFSFGTYNALLIEPGFPYTGWVQLTRGSLNSTNFRLNAQEVFHAPICFELLNRWICLPCPFDTPWCMGGTPFRDGNPTLSCPRNSLILKRCQFRRLYPYTSSWADKYDCVHADECD